VDAVVSAGAVRTPALDEQQKPGSGRRPALAFRPGRARVDGTALAEGLAPSSLLGGHRRRCATVGCASCGAEVAALALGEVAVELGVLVARPPARQPRSICCINGG
jgi:hypothetical protein